MNETVSVQLTDVGRQILHNQHAELNKFIPQDRCKWSMPREDEDGWSKWQMWVLMETFGQHMSMTGDNPFNLNIRIEEH